MTEPLGPIEEPRLHASAEFPPPVGSPVGDPPVESPHHETRPTPAVPTHRHVRRLRVGIALVAVVALGVVAALVLSRGGSPSDDGTTAGTVDITTDATDTSPEADPRSAQFADAHDSYLDGRCAEAVAAFDELLADSEWVATSSSADAALAEREECNALLDIASDTAAPSSVLADYLAFLDDRPDTPLEPTVLAAIGDLYATAGLATLTEQTCDAIDGDVDILTATDAAGALLGCAEVYLAADRADDAAVLAVDAIPRTTDAAITTRAVDIVAATPGLCSALAYRDSELNVNVLDTVETSLGDSPTAHAAILQACMVVGADDADLLAGLQMRYLVQLPLDPGSAAVEAALIENAAACGSLETMRDIDELVGRAGFLASKTLKCAQFAHYVGDRATAIELYQWFLDNTEGDERTSIAEAGLAWNRIAAARDDGITEWTAPQRAGSSGGSYVRLIIRNDAWSELDVILTGPVTQFITVDESPDSVVYPIGGRDGCRLDVPSVTIDVPGGVYEVMFERNGQRIAVGTWNLRAGSMYDFCLYLVSA